MTTRSGGLGRKVPAGLFDAGLSSLATFVVGVTAAQLFDASTLGVYAVFFTAHQLGVVLPMFLIYLPAEVKAVAYDPSHRIPILRSSVPVGLVSSVIALVAVAMAMVIVSAHADWTTIRNLAVTVSVPTVLMPAQAHVRRMLHVAGHSWRAASISAVQLVATAVALVALILLDVADSLVPFGAFSIAAMVSLLAGLVIAASLRQRGAAAVGWRELVASGRWLLVTGIVPNVAGFAIASLVGSLAGTEALGYAEGARLASQPLSVLGVGLNASLGPRSMEAAYDRDRAAARHVARVFIMIIVVFTLVALAATGGAWPWNPLSWLVSQAYELPGLTALMILGGALAGAVMPAQRELYGGGYERPLAFIEVVASLVSIAVATTTGLIGAYAVPASICISSVWRAAHYRHALNRMYGTPGATKDAGSVTAITAAVPENTAG